MSARCPACDQDFGPYGLSNSYMLLLEHILTHHPAMMIALRGEVRCACGFSGTERQARWHLMSLDSGTGASRIGEHFVEARLLEKTPRPFAPDWVREEFIQRPVVDDPVRPHAGFRIQNL